MMKMNASYLKVLEDMKRLEQSVNLDILRQVAPLQVAQSNYKKPIPNIPVQLPEVGKMNAMSEAIQKVVALNTATLSKNSEIIKNTAFIERLSILSQFNLQKMPWNDIGNAIKLPEHVKLDWQNTLSDLSRDYAALFEQSDTLSAFELSAIERASASFFITTSLTESFTLSQAGDAETEDTESFEQEKQALTEAVQAQTLSRLAFLLAELNPDLLTMLHGAEAALESKSPDYPRHFAASLRELFTHVIHQIAPDKAIQAWSQDEQNYHEGRPTRKARLRYVYRNLNGDKAVEQFLEQDIKTTLSFIDLFQKGTHEVSTLYTELQLKMMLLKMQSVLLQLLEGNRSVPPPRFA
jgi:hypothetical protein